MRKAAACLFAVVCCAQAQDLVPRVSTAAKAGDFAYANRALDQFKKANGVTPEYLAALSWIGRGELAAGHHAEALKNAESVRQMALAQVSGRKLESSADLQTALGASIEVDAQATAAMGRRDEAVLFLQDEVKRWSGTAIHARIAKNLNLLSLEGKPALPLETSQWIGATKPRSMEQHRGRAVLLFFWAHWCSDCREEIPVIEKLKKTYGARGLDVVGPTQHYGYVAGGEDAPPAVETKYIGQVFSKIYSGLSGVEVPLSEQNFRAYGVSTTPTLVLVDGAGIVRMYHPGKTDYKTLAAKIEAVLAKR